MDKKKVIAALMLLSVPTIGVAGVKDEIPKCTTQENFTVADVKYAGDGVFIDADGYQVEACMVDDSVYFPIVAKIKDGAEIFKKLTGKTLHPDRPQVKQEEPTEQRHSSYSLTYGDGNYEIEDVDTFREKAKAKAMGAFNIGGEPISTDEVLSVVAIPANLEMPMEFTNAIAPEKQDQIQKDYDEIMKSTVQAHETMVGTITQDLISLFAKNNRIFLSQQVNINQYATQEHGASGIAYAIFDARLAASDFLNGYVKVVNHFATTQDIDERLKVMEYLKQQDPMVMAGKYAAQKVDTLLIAIKSDPSAVEAMGKDKLAKAAPEDKVAFFEIVSAANEKIMQDEYDSMPDEITKKQYKALSNIDKDKYAPVQSGQYVNHDRYRKLPRDKVVNRPLGHKE